MIICLIRWILLLSILFYTYSGLETHIRFLKEILKNRDWHIHSSRYSNIGYKWLLLTTSFNISSKVQNRTKRKLNQASQISAMVNINKWWLVNVKCTNTNFWHRNSKSLWSCNMHRRVRIWINHDINQFEWKIWL